MFRNTRCKEPSYRISQGDPLHMDERTDAKLVSLISWRILDKLVNGKMRKLEK